MLGFFSPPGPDGLERARLVASGAVALTAVLMAALLLGEPREAALAAAALTPERIPEFVEDVGACRQALEDAGFDVSPLPDLRQGACGYTEAVELTQSVHPYSAPVAGSCAMVAALALWERDVVAPAARRRFGQGVARIELAGSTYSCRRVAGRRDRRLSEHARANAIDIGGFTLEDGRQVRVAGGWRGRGDERAFLRDVRDGACRYFEAVLSPDYNRAHRDHLHLDLGRDKMCR